MHCANCEADILAVTDKHATINNNWLCCFCSIRLGWQRNNRHARCAIAAQMLADDPSLRITDSPMSYESRYAIYDESASIPNDPTWWNASYPTTGHRFVTTNFTTNSNDYRINMAIDRLDTELQRESIRDNQGEQITVAGGNPYLHVGDNYVVEGERFVVTSPPVANGDGTYTVQVRRGVDDAHLGGPPPGGNPPIGRPPETIRIHDEWQRAMENTDVPTTVWGSYPRPVIGDPPERPSGLNQFINSTPDPDAPPLTEEVLMRELRWAWNEIGAPIAPMRRTEPIGSYWENSIYRDEGQNDGITGPIERSPEVRGQRLEGLSSPPHGPGAMHLSDEVRRLSGETPTSEGLAERSDDGLRPNPRLVEQMAEFQRRLGYGRRVRPVGGGR